ncbi:hypothetical protein BH10CHL1_BH10CHL1_25840 [soil metagenome]
MAIKQGPLTMTPLTRSAGGGPAVFKLRVMRPLSIWLTLCMFCVVQLASACAPVQKSPYDAAQATTTGQRATAKEALAGGAFNKFFPKSNDNYSIVYTQEKIGFAEVVLKSKTEDVATLSIFDTVSNPDAAAKYKASTKQVSGYPATDIGNNGTSILVADRFQVQVRTKAASFTAQDRETWLAAFDLAGLAKLQ